MQNKVSVISTSKINNVEFKVYGDVNNPLFLAAEVAKVIGHTKVDKMIKNVDEEEKVKKEMDGTLSTTQRGGYRDNTEYWFLTEYGLYEVLMQSRKPIAKAFKKEVKDILIQLRKTGVVIMENATEENVNYEYYFGNRRIKKTFLSVDAFDIFRKYEDFKQETNNQKYITGSEKLKKIKKIYEAILAKEAEEKDATKKNLLVTFENYILKDMLILNNRVKGGEKAAKTIKLKKTNKLLEDIITKLEPDISEFSCLSYHGFSQNYMYNYKEIDNKGKVRRSNIYNNWLFGFPAEEAEIYINDLDVNWHEPVEMYIKYVCKDGLDVQNFNKATIDVLFSLIKTKEEEDYRVDDNLIKKVVAEKVATCKDYKDGKIYFYIKNC